MATPYQERKIADPVMNVGDEPYFEAAAQGRLLVKKCADCGEVHYYPRGICPFCLSEAAMLSQSFGAEDVCISVGCAVEYLPIAFEFPFKQTLRQRRTIKCVTRPGPSMRWRR